MESLFAGFKVDAIDGVVNRGELSVMSKQSCCNRCFSSGSVFET